MRRLGPGDAAVWNDGLQRIPVVVEERGRDAAGIYCRVSYACDDGTRGLDRVHPSQLRPPKGDPMTKKRSNPEKPKPTSSARADRGNHLASSAPRPEPFSDSFTTTDACFSVEVKAPWGEVTEDIEVKIDCGGMIHGDEGTIDVLIEMLENARENLVARRGELTRERLETTRSVHRGKARRA